MPTENQLDDMYREVARNEYGGDGVFAENDIRVLDSAAVHTDEDGAWVQAWVRVPLSSLEDD